MQWPLQSIHFPIVHTLFLKTEPTLILLVSYSFQLFQSNMVTVSLAIKSCWHFSISYNFPLVFIPAFFNILSYDKFKGLSVTWFNCTWISITRSVSRICTYCAIILWSIFYLTWLHLENIHIWPCVQTTSSLHDLLYCGLSLYWFRHLWSSTLAVEPFSNTASQYTSWTWSPSSHVLEHGPHFPTCQRLKYNNSKQYNLL